MATTLVSVFCRDVSSCCEPCHTALASILLGLQRCSVWSASMTLQDRLEYLLGSSASFRAQLDELRSLQDQINRAEARRRQRRSGPRANERHERMHIGVG